MIPPSVPPPSNAGPLGANTPVKVVLLFMIGAVVLCGLAGTCLLVASLFFQ